MAGTMWAMMFLMTTLHTHLWKASTLDTHTATGRLLAMSQASISVLRSIRVKCQHWLGRMLLIYMQLPAAASNLLEPACLVQCSSLLSCVVFCCCICGYPFCPHPPATCWQAVGWCCQCFASTLAGLIVPLESGSTCVSSGMLPHCFACALAVPSRSSGSSHSAASKWQSKCKAFD